MKTISKKLKTQLIKLIGYEALRKRETGLSDVDSEAREKLRAQVLETVYATQFEELVSLMVAAGILDIAVGDLNDETDGYAAFKAINFYETDNGFTLQAGEIHTSGSGVHNKMPKSITTWFSDYSIMKKAA